jgi:hypothetical protein
MKRGIWIIIILLMPLAAAEDCIVDDDCENGYCDNGVCIAYESSTGSGCVSDNDCDTANGYVCDGSTYVCALPADVAEVACDEVTPCETGYECVDGGCVAETVDAGFTSGPGALMEDVVDSVTDTVVDVGYAGLSKVTNSSKIADAYANYKTGRSSEKLAENSVNTQRVKKGQMSEKTFSKKTTKNIESSLKGLSKAQTVVAKSGSQTAQTRINALASKGKKDLSSLESNSNYKKFTGDNLQKVKTSYSNLIESRGVSKGAATFDCIAISSGEQVQGVTYVIENNCVGIGDAVVCNDGAQWTFYEGIVAYTSSGSVSGSSATMIYSGDQYDLYVDDVYLSSGSLSEYGNPVLSMKGDVIWDVIYTYDSSSFMLGKNVLLKGGNGVEACQFVNAQSAAAQPLGGASIEMMCANGVDDDGDGFADCEDSDCEVKAICRGEMQGSLTMNPSYAGGNAGAPLATPQKNMVNTPIQGKTPVAALGKTGTMERPGLTSPTAAKPVGTLTGVKQGLSATGTKIETKPTLSTTAKPIGTSTPIGTKPTLSATSSPTMTAIKPTLSTTSSPTMTATKPTLSATLSSTTTATKPTLSATSSSTTTATKPTLSATSSSTTTATKPTLSATSSSTTTATKPTLSATSSSTTTATKPTLSTTAKPIGTSTQTGTKPTSGAPAKFSAPVQKPAGAGQRPGGMKRTGMVVAEQTREVALGFWRFILFR